VLEYGSAANPFCNISSSMMLLNSQPELVDFPDSAMDDLIRKLL